EQRDNGQNLARGVHMIDWVVSGVRVRVCARDITARISLEEASRVGVVHARASVIEAGDAREPMAAEDRDATCIRACSWRDAVGRPDPGPPERSVAVALEDVASRVREGKEGQAAVLVCPSVSAVAFEN